MKSKKQDQKQQKKKVEVKHFFYESEQYIPDNLLRSWFENKDTVKINLRSVDIKLENKQFYITGRIVCMDKYHVVVINSADKEVVIYKHDISNIKKHEQEVEKK